MKPLSVRFKRPSYDELLAAVKQIAGFNEYEIAVAVARHREHPVLGRATRFLAAFREHVNENGDGWPYWRQSVQSAAKLMTMIQHPETANEEAFKAALTPIRSFYTRHGTAAALDEILAIVKGR